MGLGQVWAQDQKYTVIVDELLNGSITFDPALPAAACANMPDKIGTGGFGATSGVFEFMPSYVPENKAVEQMREEMMAAIKGAAPSYGVFGGQLLNHYSDNPAADDTWKSAIAPMDNIPPVREREVPQYLTRGPRPPNDTLISTSVLPGGIPGLSGDTI